MVFQKSFKISCHLEYLILTFWSHWTIVFYLTQFFSTFWKFRFKHFINVVTTYPIVVAENLPCGFHRLTHIERKIFRTFLYLRPNVRIGFVNFLFLCIGIVYMLLFLDQHSYCCCLLVFYMNFECLEDFHKCSGFKTICFPVWYFRKV